ncbi:MAG: hypothetical protein GX386_03330 [Clostridiaceae bacterium]|jgi:hypothetical protein|nr:hypothetical protein [Clostridiaceae bacterium]
MITTLNVVIIGLVFVIIDLIPMYQNKEWISFFLSVSLLIISLILVVLIDLKVKIPSPSDYIEKIVTFIFGLE